MNLGLSRVYLRHSDPMVAQRTWQHVLDEIIKLKSGPTQYRWLTRTVQKLERGYYAAIPGLSLQVRLAVSEELFTTKWR